LTRKLSKVSGKKRWVLMKMKLYDFRTWIPAVYFNDTETQKKFVSSYFSSNRNSGSSSNNSKPKDTSGDSNKGTEEKAN
jgi:hypothetical protein